MPALPVVFTRRAARQVEAAALWWKVNRPAAPNALRDDLAGALRLSLTDDSTREVDLGPYLNGPVFEPVRNDSAFFRSVHVDEELGTLVWPNGADIDPDVLILGRTPASFETASSGSRAR